MTPWLQLGERVVHLEELPLLLERSNLLLPLLRRILLEASVCSIQISREEQLAFHARFLARNGLESEEALKAWLAQRNLTEEQASANVLEALQLERFKNERFGQDVERIFLETKDQRDRVVYSLLRLQDRAAAEELYLRLEEGDATFTDLCEQHSSGPERDTGGLIGPLPLSRLHPQLAELLRISQPGQLWKPMLVENFWVVIRLDKRLPAQLDQAMEQQIRDECFEQWVKQQLDQFMAAYHQAQSASASASAATPQQAVSDQPQ